MTYLIGQRLGRYEVQEEIGRGGMARVYRGLDTQLRRTVALKVLAPQLAIDPEFTRRFDREAVTVANLRHPNIVTIYDVGEHDGLRYIAMEFIRGRSLYAIIEERGALGLSYAIAIVDPIAAALDYAHSQGAVHRDVKPQNILVDTDGRVLLMDFGIAQGPEQRQERLTRTGLFMGTPEYISPEQASAERVDGRSDLYSLGIATYEIITGVVPFAGATPQLIVAHVQSPPPPPSTIAPDQPPELDAVLARILAKRPESRFGNGAAFTAALRLVARKHGVPVATTADLADLVVPNPLAQPAAPRTIPTASTGRGEQAPLYGAPGNGSGAIDERTAVGQSPLVDVLPPRPRAVQPRRPVAPRAGAGANDGGRNIPWTAIGLLAGGLLLALLFVFFRPRSNGPNPFSTSTAQPVQLIGTALPTPPTPTPTALPTAEPTTVAPTPAPTALPTDAPTSPPEPTRAPTRTRSTPVPATLPPAPVPTEMPTEAPPTEVPPTEMPTEAPPTEVPPTETPTEAPPTSTPTIKPTATDLPALATLTSVPTEASYPVKNPVASNQTPVAASTPTPVVDQNPTRSPTPDSTLVPNALPTEAPPTATVQPTIIPPTPTEPLPPDTAPTPADFARAAATFSPMP